MSVTFPTLGDFLRNRRIETRTDGSFIEDSYDLGVHWLDRVGGQYRLTWIGPAPVGRGPKSGDPGELYLIRVPDGMTEFLCVIPPADGPRPAENAENILDGWAEVCGLPNSTDWIRDRVYEALRAGWAQNAGARSRFPNDSEVPR